MLRGRRAEQERIDVLLDAARNGISGALIVRGEPGIGKTALWRLAVERCAEAGVGVLLTRPAEEDMAFGLAALVLAGLIVLYNWHHKANPLSPVVMGLCRFMVYVAAATALTGSLADAPWLGATLLLSYLVGSPMRRSRST